MALRYAVHSDPGLARERNEDHAGALPDRGVFAIADGMGGHIAGEVASRVAVDSAVAFLEACTTLDLDALARAIECANHAVHEEAARRELWGMGTTLTLAHVASGSVEIAHVGDSRAYLLRESRLEQLTTDQTMVELMVRQGVLRREHTRHHPERHVLVQALGTQDQILPELQRIDDATGARLLLTTDGLHDQITDAALLEFGTVEDLQRAADALVRAAIQTGGPDNITVVLVQL